MDKYFSMDIAESDVETVDGNLVRISVAIEAVKSGDFVREIFDYGILKILHNFSEIERLKNYKKIEAGPVKVLAKWGGDLRAVALNRPGFKWTAEEELAVQVRYFLVNRIFYADQWSLRSDEEMQDFYNRGFRIECFGSPFNVRLPYFGSLYVEDEPFGSVGTCIDLLKKIINTGELKWRNKVVVGKNQVVKLIFSPSTYTKLILEIFDLLKILFKKRKCVVHFGLTADFHTAIEKGSLISHSFRYMLKKVKWEIKPLTTVKCFHGGEPNMEGRVIWNDYIFKN
jgi:hypothetical protein